MAPTRRNSKNRKLSETTEVVVSEEPADKSVPEKKNASGGTRATTKLEDSPALQHIISKPRTRRFSEKHLIKIVKQEQNENDCPTKTSERREEEAVPVEDSESNEKDHFRPANGAITVHDIDIEDELLNKEVSETFSRLVNSEGEEMETSSSVRRGRGRPRKQTVTESKPTRKNYEQTVKTDPTESESKLRRRDRIRVTERYSPELTETNKRQRKSITFPSTATRLTTKLEGCESEDDENTVSIQPALLHTKKMLLKRSSSDQPEEVAELEAGCGQETSSSQVYIVDMKKDCHEGKVLLTLADGASYCIETKKRRRIDDEDDDEDFFVEEDDLRDKDYKESPRRRVSKIQVSKQCPVQVAVVNNVNEVKPGSCQATGIKIPKLVRKPAKSTTSTPSSRPVSPL